MRHSAQLLLLPSGKGVNLKSGRYFLSLPLFMVHFSFPSDFVMSNCISPSNFIAPVTMDTISRIVISVFSFAEKKEANYKAVNSIVLCIRNK